MALKRLQPLLMREPLIRERFRREAALGVRIRHPHVVRTLGRVGSDCLLMEWIDGDELVEITPEAVRVRKRVLACNLRDRRQDAIEQAQATH